MLLARSRPLSRPPRARELVRGAYDLHVHVEPDLAQAAHRRSRARAPLRRARAGGLRAQVALRADRGACRGRARGGARASDALGAITLNAGVGGLNAQAVEIAARGGARIVWLPTVDSENEASEDGPKPAKQPVWRKIQDEFAAAGVGERARAR